jgi:purine-binding chemotaxis protein CheW
MNRGGEYYRFRVPYRMRDLCVLNFRSASLCSSFSVKFNQIVSIVAGGKSLCMVKITAAVPQSGLAIYRANLDEVPNQNFHNAASARSFVNVASRGERGKLGSVSRVMNQIVSTAAAASASPNSGNWAIGEPSGKDSGAIQFVSFAIGADQYGVDIMAVREIKVYSDITHLPKQPDYVRGVLNLRGVVIPIVDLRCRFDRGLTEATSLHVIIIVQVGNRQVGLLADRVLDIVSFEQSQVQAVPQVSASAQAHFLSGVVTTEDSMMALIDLPALVSATPDEIEASQAS